MGSLYRRVLRSRARLAGRRRNDEEKPGSGQAIATKRFQDKDFLKLRKQWYAKLSRKGFKDIELTDWQTGEAWERTNGISQQDVCNTYSPEAERYYQVAVHWVRVMAFRRCRRRAKRLGLPHVTRSLHVDIWREHADGTPYRAIGRKVGCSKGTVENVVNREKALMLAFDYEKHADLLDSA